MSKFEKLLLIVLYGQSDNNINFEDIRVLLSNLEFRERIKGSHHIFTHSNVEEIINIQPIGKFAKPYQVKQIRKIIIKYSLGNIYEKLSL